MDKNLLDVMRENEISNRMYRINGKYVKFFINDILMKFNIYCQDEEFFQRNFIVKKLEKFFTHEKFILTVTDNLTDYIRVYRKSKQHRWFKEEYPNSKKIDKFIEENQQFSYDPINTDDEEYDLKYEVTIDSYFKLYKSNDYNSGKNTKF